MDFNSIEKIIDENIELIEISAKSLSEARERAAKFLVVYSILANFLRNLEENIAKMNTIVDASYAKSIKYAQGKNITERKISVNEDIDYTSNREALEKMNAGRDWIKTHMKIFDHAHLMFRQYSRE